MKRLLSLLFISIAYCSYSQNIGINTTVPTASLDVNGDFILRSGDLILANGNNLVDVGTNPYSNYRLTGPTAAFNITGISYSWDGKLVTLFNRSGHTMTVVNESPAEATSERIITGTAANVIIPTNASINLQYDIGATRWVVRSHSAATGSTGTGGANYWVENSSGSISNTNTANVGIGTDFPFSKLTVNGDGYMRGSGIIAINDPREAIRLLTAASPLQALTPVTKIPTSNYQAASYKPTFRILTIPASMIMPETWSLIHLAAMLASVPIPRTPTQNLPSKRRRMPLLPCPSETPAAPQSLMHL